MNIHSPKAASLRAFDLGGMVMDALNIAPQTAAFRFDGINLSRGELRDQAGVLAARLQEAGVRPGMAVALEIEHSLDLPIAMCALQIIGACAVPSDPQASPTRRTAILADVCAEFVLKQNRTRMPSIVIEQGPKSDSPRKAIDPDLAFVVYTSGSSGGPKGVMITRESYVRRMQHVLPSFSPQPDDVDLAWTPSSFTVMVDEMFLPILAGMTSVIAPPALRTDPRGFAELVRREGVTNIRLTPSMLDLALRTGVAGDLAKVRTIVCSGEALPADLQTRAHEMLPNATLLGFYGATEAPAVAFIPYDRDVPPNNATICTPQPFAKLKIMRQDATPADDGETGEVWIGGLPVARGYFGRPELTAEKFLTVDGERWYRTGDLGRMRAAGQVEILGRADTSEVNINGARVSLPEIVETLRANPAVDAAWVSAVAQEGRRDLTLVAHCVSRAGHRFDASALRADLVRRLPSPSIPARLFSVDSLPLTDNGKVDAKRLEALAAEGLNNPQSTDRDANHPLLDIVLEVASDVLGVTGLMGADSFFASGGDSLKAVNVALGLTERLGREVETTWISNSETFCDIARALSCETDGTAFSAQLIRDGDADAPQLFTLNDRRRYEILAQQLATLSPVWNLNMFGLTGGGLSSLDAFELEELATVFADKVQAKQPTGPWHLVAFCQSACLAIEIARVLQDRTGKASKLIFIDAFFTEYLPTRRVQFMRLLDFGPTYYARKVLRKFGYIPRAAYCEDVPMKNGTTAVNLSKKDRALHKRFDALCWSYPVRPYDGPVTMFVSKEFRHNSRVSLMRLAGDRAKVQIVDGLHLTVFQPKQNGQSLAEGIDAELRG